VHIAYTVSLCDVACSKCNEIIQQLTEFAKSHRSALSFRYGEKAIILKCSKGHEWQVDIKYRNLSEKNGSGVKPALSKT
jgi:hypothetical protein